jgi:hypothetical protein
VGRRGAVIGAIGLVAIVALVAIAGPFSRPTVPPDAATNPIAQAIPSSETAFASECVPRIQNATGAMDVCWEAERYSNDADPAKDYYLLHVWSTFGGVTGSGARWAVLKANLVGAPADGVFGAWPDGDFDGSCRQIDVTLQLAQGPIPVDVCGHTSGSDTEGWGHRATWTCEGWCLIPGQDDRALNLFVWVGVAEGTIPSWDIYADLGA